MDDPVRKEMEAGEPGAELAQIAGRGVRVGAYEGLRAGEAIVAVRERGLRPSLERVEGYAEARQGFVVSQEPAADSEVAADSQVFLYIGAPARAVAGSAATGEVAEEEEEEEEEEASVGVDESTVELEPVEGDAFDEEGDREADPAGEEWDERDEGEEELAADEDAAGAEPAPVDELGSVDGLALVDEAGSVGEPEPLEEPTRVWRGPEPGSGLGRGFAENVGGWDRGERFEGGRSRENGWLARLPLGVKVAAFGLLACAVLTLLVSVAARSGGSAASGRGARTAGVAAGSPEAPVVRTARGRAARARVERAGRIELEARPVTQAAGRRRTVGRAREARPAKEVVRVVVVRAPAGTVGGEAAVESVPSAAELRAADEERAVREFGP